MMQGKGPPSAPWGLSGGSTSLRDLVHTWTTRVYCTVNAQKTSLTKKKPTESYDVTAVASLSDASVSGLSLPEFAVGFDESNKAMCGQSRMPQTGMQRRVTLHSNSETAVGRAQAAVSIVGIMYDVQAFIHCTTKERCHSTVVSDQDRNGSCPARHGGHG
jgi:hypothetical protein